MRTLSHPEARRVYDRIGARQDSQAFYEDVATHELLEHGDFQGAESVFELGCGTGRFAATLLRDHLGPGARYRGIDLSPKMISLAEGRISPHGERARVRLTDGSPRIDEPSESFDRFVSTFVLDLLSEEDINAFLAEAHRVLRPGGLLCVASLAPPRGAASRLVIGVWSLLHRLSPKLVGGCRPIELTRFLGAGWKLRHHAQVAPWALPCEAIVAERLPAVPAASGASGAEP